MIAGKYAKLMQSPATAMTIGGLGAAGVSLASNQGEGKSYGRQALEALGAGALGAGVGRLLPTVSRIAAENAANQRGRFAQGLQTEGSNVREVARGLYERGVHPQEIVDAANATIGANQAATNTAAAVGGLGLATGLGGQIGGGVANLGNMAGLAIDPESPGSSNTQGSRMSMQTQQLPMY